MTVTSTEQIEAGTYTLNPVHSTFGFAIRHNGVLMFRGRFEQVEAKLENGVLTGAARVESLTTAIPELTAHLHAPDFFDAAATPTIEFRSTAIRLAGDGSASVDGELTIRGVANAMTATGTWARGENFKSDEVVGLALEATIDRRDYGLIWQAQLPNGADVLAWDVTLEADFELFKS